MPRSILPALITSLLVIQNAQAQVEEIQFDRDIRPLLSNNCFHCHGPDEEHREADLRLDIEEQAKEWAVVEGKPLESEVYNRLITDDPDLRMPPASSNKELKPEEIERLKKWIEQGAKWKMHWSFIAPVQSLLPEVSHKNWPKNPIDYFVLSKLEKNNLQPEEEADRRTLIRRLSLDLTGLPPTLKETEEFLNDSSPEAYEKLVDRLLNSLHYGERMAVNWLDAARYGDTSVYHADGFRDMWAWRDRIVDMYNLNLPFDQFSIEQLAGDLIPKATLEQKISAGFNRNNGTTDEGGLIPEEYRVEYAVDRVKTTATVWLGLTMECGQCHEHKYDPITQEEYYKFFAFFNVSADAGSQSRERNSDPIVKIMDPAKMEKLPTVQEQLAEIDKKKQDRKAAVLDQFHQWVAETEKEGHLKNPVPSDTTVHLTLNEGEGSNVVDSTNSELKGKIKGKADWVKGRFDKALKLDGKTHVNLGDVAGFDRTDSFSYGGWVWIEPGATGAILARMDDKNKYRGYDILITANGNVEVHLVHTWPENALKIKSKKELPPQQWNHVMAVYDGSSKSAGIQVYVNGELWESTVEKDQLTETIKTERSLWIGSRFNSSKLTGIVDDIRVYSRVLNQTEIQAISESHPLNAVFKTKAEERTEEQKKELEDYYFENKDPDYQTLSKEYKQLKKEEENLLVPVTTVMVMGDQENPRDTFILNRGSYDSPTETKVERGTPSVLPPMAEGLPRNRLGLAKWLFQENHPLTARVAVNRYWQLLFGTGFVSTPEDFGSQGEFPTHPELLDWLAVDFRESGWDVKRMIKQIVMSATYRQSSRVTPEKLQADPENKLLSRGARFRLQGEFVRDNALFLSGLLVDKKGGPGVKPYQPPGLWKEVGLGGKPEFVQDHGESLYRRSLYTYWKRSAPPPNMQIFDAPTREKCTVRRPRTNTPLQALVVLNDVQFVEASRKFASRIIREGGSTPEERAEFAFEMATARKPNENEKSTLLEIYQHSYQKYLSDPESAGKLINTGEMKLLENLDPVDQAAWTVVANLILNLDETLTRE